MATAGQRGGDLAAREGAQHGGFSCGTVLDSQEIKLGLHIEVIEGQVDPALGVGNDEPHAVQAAPVLLGVVWGQHGP